jgi:hypothetical protein
MTSTAQRCCRQRASRLKCVIVDPPAASTANQHPASIRSCRVGLTPGSVCRAGDKASSYDFLQLAARGGSTGPRPGGV